MQAERETRRRMELFRGSLTRGTGVPPTADEETSMATDWQLIRDVLNGTIDACQALEELAPDLEAGEYEARSDYQDDVCVGDFLTRFWQYPEGAARDVIRLRSRLASDQKHPSEIARALVNAALACAEAIGLSDEELARELPEFEAHCGSGGQSVKSLLEGIPAIQNGWMLTGIRGALDEFRRDRD